MENEWKKLQLNSRDGNIILHNPVCIDDENYTYPSMRLAYTVKAFWITRFSESQGRPGCLLYLSPSFHLWVHCFQTQAQTFSFWCLESRMKWCHDETSQMEGEHFDTRLWFIAMDMTSILVCVYSDQHTQRFFFHIWYCCSTSPEWFLLPVSLKIHQVVIYWGKMF